MCDPKKAGKRRNSLHDTMSGFISVLLICTIIFTAAFSFGGCSLIGDEVDDLLGEDFGLGSLIGGNEGTSQTPGFTDPSTFTNEKVSVKTLDEELAGDTYGLLYPKQRTAYVGREFYKISDEDSMILAVNDGLLRGIRGIVLQYDDHDYNYWLKMFEGIQNRSEIAGLAGGDYTIVQEDNHSMCILPEYKYSWEAYTYYRFKEPEIGEESMKLLRAAHELAEEAIKAHYGDTRSILGYVNDRLNAMAEYPDPIPAAGTHTPEYDATGVFFKGSSVCAGFTAAYRLVLNILGFENDVISNNKRPDDQYGHIWNRVKLDGYMYHVDVTWNRSEWAEWSNRYFLLTDEELSALTAGSESAIYHEWTKPLTQKE